MLVNRKSLKEIKVSLDELANKANEAITLEDDELRTDVDVYGLIEDVCDKIDGILALQNSEED